MKLSANALFSLVIQQDVMTELIKRLSAETISTVKSLMM